MNRILVMLVVLAAAAFTVAVPQRDIPVTPTAPEDTSVEAQEVASARSVARCPWVRGDGFIEGEVAVGAPEAEEATFTVAAAGSVVGTSTLSVAAFAAVPFLDLANIGTGSVFVEVDNEPAAVVAVGEGEAAVASAGCRSGASKVWLLGGGSTLDGETLQLRLFNPFPQDARVEIQVVSENDVEPEASLESLSVAAQSTATFDLGSLLSLRETLALRISDPEGLIVPALVQAGEVEDEEGNSRDVDLAAWAGVTAARRWEFPFAAVAGLDSSITIVNDQTVPVSWTLDVFGEESSTTVAASGTLEPLTVTRVPLADLAAAPSGVVVTGDEPIGAFLTASGPTERAATAGVSSARRKWLMPGVSVMAGTSQVWVMNTGATPATVTFTSSRDGQLGQPDKLLVPAGTIRVFSSRDDLVLESQEPVSVGWIRSTGTATAFTVATPVSDG